MRLFVSSLPPHPPACREIKSNYPLPICLWKPNAIMTNHWGMWWFTVTPDPSFNEGELLCRRPPAAEEWGHTSRETQPCGTTASSCRRRFGKCVSILCLFSAACVTRCSCTEDRIVFELLWPKGGGGGSLNVSESLFVLSVGACALCATWFT